MPILSALVAAKDLLLFIQDYTPHTTIVSDKENPSTETISK